MDGAGTDSELDERLRPAKKSTPGWRGPVLVAAALALGLPIAGCGGGGDSGAGEASTITIALPADGPTYRDPGGAYVLEVGPDWEAGSVSQPKIWFTHEAAKGFRSNVNATVEQVPGSASLQDYVKLSVKNAPALLPQLKSVSIDYLNESGGRQLARWHYRGSYNGRALEWLAITGLRDGKAVTLTFTSLPAVFADQVKDVEPYMRTLRVLPS
jgi:hypothetical protein